MQWGAWLTHLAGALDCLEIKMEELKDEICFCLKLAEASNMRGMKHDESGFGNGSRRPPVADVFFLLLVVNPQNL
jgi:hypothetical protein